jgi:hypothetical protein
MEQQPQQQYAIYVSHHAHVAYLLSICRNLNELKEIRDGKLYLISEEEKLSLWNMRHQIKQRLNQVQQFHSMPQDSTVASTNNVNSAKNNQMAPLLHSDHGKAMDVEEIREIEELGDMGEFEEINDEIGHFGSCDTQEEVETEVPELALEWFPFPTHQVNVECLLVTEMINKCAFIDSLIGSYYPPPLACPFCHQLVDYNTMRCIKNHTVELCMKTFLPLIDVRNHLKCRYCCVSALDLSKSNFFKWVYNDNKCAISGHKIHKIKYS